MAATAEDLQLRQRMAEAAKAKLILKSRQSQQGVGGALGLPGAETVSGEPVVSQSEVLTEKGVSLDGANLDARFFLGLIPQSEEFQNPEFLGGYLSGILNEEVKVAREPETNRLIFTQKDGSQTAVNPPGFDAGDLAGVAGDAGVLTTEVLAGLAGAFGGSSAGPGGSAVGAISGAALGAATGEFIKTVVGLSQSGMDPNDIIKEALVQSAFTGGIALGGGAFGGLATFLATKIGRKFFPTVNVDDAFIDDVLVKIDEAAKDTDALAERTGANVSLTAKQATQDPGLSADETAIRNQPEFSRQFQQQEAELTEASSDLLGQSEVEGVTGQADTFAAGQAIQDPISQRIDDVTSTARSRIADTQEAIENNPVVADLDLDARPFVATQEGGEVLFASVQASLDASKRRIAEARAALDTAAQALPRSTSEKPIFVRNLSRSAQQISEDDKKVVLGFLKNKEFGEELFDDIQALGKLPDDSIIVMPKGAEATPGRMTFDEADATLSRLSALIRKVERGEADTNVDIGLLKKVKTSLDRDIRESLSDFPEVALAYDNYRNLVFAEKQAFQRSVVSDITKLRVGGREALHKEDIFRKTALSGDTNANELADALMTDRALLTDVDRAQFDEAVRIVRDGLRQEYTEKVFKQGIDKPNTKAHQEFLKRHSTAIKRFFPEEDQGQFQRLGGLIDVMERRQSSLNFSEKAIKKSFGGLIDNINDPRDVFKTVWQKGTAADMTRLMGLLKRRGVNKEAIDQLRLTAMNDVRQKIFSKGPLDRSPLEFNLPALQDLVGSSESRKKIRTLMGDQYLADLTLLNRLAFRVKTRPELASGQDLSNASFGQMLRTLIAPPLSPRGRFLTGVEIAAKNQANKVLSQAFMQPKRLADLMKAANNRQAGARLFEILSAFNANYFTLILENQEEVRDLNESLRKRFQGNLNSL